jgi:hypothetical protein
MTTVAQGGGGAANLPVAKSTISSLQDPYIFPMEFNAVDPDVVVSSFFELVARRGYSTKRQEANSLSDFKRYLKDLEGQSFIKTSDFSPPAIPALEVLDGWIMWNLLVPRGSGIGRQDGEKMRYFRPVTPGVIRSGLPKGRLDIRHADTWLYRLSLDFMRLTDGNVTQPHRRNDLQKLLLEGSGVDIHGAPESGEPRYDGTSNIDINSRLVLEFLKTFADAKYGESFPTEPWNASKRSRSQPPTGIDKQPVLSEPNGHMFPIEALILAPGALLPIGQVAVILLRKYHKTGQTAQMAEHLSGLLRIVLMQAPIRAARALRQLLSDPTIAAEGDFLPTGLMSEAPGRLATNPTEMFCDFTNGTDSRVADLARKCVIRDLEWQQRLLADRLSVRALTMVHPYLEIAERSRLEHIRSRSRFEYVKELLKVSQTYEFAQSAKLLLVSTRSDLEAAVQAQSPNQAKAKQDERFLELFNSCEVAGVPSHEVMANFLLQVHGPNGRGIEMQQTFFRKVSGLGETSVGSAPAFMGGSRLDHARYAPSDRMLVAMMQLAFASEDGRSERTQMSLGDLIKVLRTRLGILIDVPPVGLGGQIMQEVGLANRRAFSRKLQLLGCFEGLSDDAEYQRVRAPRVAGK